MLFGNCWDRAIWQFLFLVVFEYQVFSVVWGWGWYFRDTDYCPATHFFPTIIPSCPLELQIGESPDDQCIHDAMVTACVSLRACGCSRKGEVG